MNSVSNREGATASRQDRARWYKTSIWFLPIVVVGLSFLSIHVFSNEREIITTPPLTLETTGPNLLQNSSFKRSSKAWIAYHNRQLMKIQFHHEASAVEIHLGTAADSVEELYQSIVPHGARNLVATGEIRISGAPLPRGASAEIVVADSFKGGVTKFSLISSDGTGTFPFAFAYPASNRLFVLRVVVGNTLGNQTVVAFQKLKIARSKD